MVDFEAVIPKTKVIETARDFLRRCGFQFEIGGKSVTIPESVELVVCTRVFIQKEDSDLQFLGTHYEASVLFGRWTQNPDWPDFGILRLYFTCDGKLVTEDWEPAFHA